MSTVIDLPVLVIGAGPTGLAASICLSRAGVKHLLVERHPATSIHPKARGVNVRTMELFRQWHIHDDVRRAGLSAEENIFFYRGPTLAAEVFDRWGGGGKSDEARGFSFETWLQIAQDALEPVMLDHARELGGDIRFGYELVDLVSEPEGMVATVTARDGGTSIIVRARWVIGADGADSRVRASAQTELDGEGPLVDNVSILFKAPLGDLVADRRSVVYFLSSDPRERPRGYPMSVGNPPGDGVILAIDNADRWLLLVADTGVERDPARAVELVRRAIGRSDRRIDIVSFMSWSPSARVARAYRAGRSFVAGDAAHQMTPSGAFGLNVGIGDAHNLAWKIAAVEAGWAGESLLDTYDAERRPLAALAANESLQQFLGNQPPKPFANWGIIFGATYASDAVIDDGSPLPPEHNPVTDFLSDGRPGSRAPHRSLHGEGAASTLDLYGSDFVLLAGRSGEAWVDEAAGEAPVRGMPLRTYQLGRDVHVDDPDAFEAGHGIEATGAVLVRPDGHVAWRQPSSRSQGDPGIHEVLTRILGR